MKSAPISSILFACLAFVPALQATPVTTTFGDIILGFKATEGQGADTNLEVNLGSSATFRNAGAAPFPVLGRLAVQDLINTFGEDWATRPDLSWGLAGTTGGSAVSDVPGRTVWASRKEDTPGTPSTPWRTASLFTMGTPTNSVSALYRDSPGSLGNPLLNATANSIYSARIVNTLGGSWTAQEAGTPNVSFAYFNPSVMNLVNTFPSAGSAHDGKKYTVLDLYEVRGTSPPQDATLLGGLGLNSQGELVFSKDVTKFAPPSTIVELGQPTLTLNTAGTAATVTLAAAPMGNYVLERSTTLAASSWTQVDSKTGVSGNLTFNDNAAPSGRGYYRVRKTT